MAFLRVRSNGEWTIGFRFSGTEFHRSCHTNSENVANRIRARVEETLDLLKGHRLQIPADVEPGAWILSGGTLRPNPVSNGKLHSERFGEICSEYLKDSRQKHDTTLETEIIHIRHLKKYLNASTRLHSIDLKSLKQYRNRRRRAKFRGKAISDVTIKKELSTFRQIWGWAKQNGFVKAGCPLLDDDGRWKIRFEKADTREKFQTWEQIQRKIKRGGLTEEEIKELWEGLYLDQGQVCDLLIHVEKQAAHSFIYPMFTFAAYTGARRSEILRSQIDDFDFEANQVTIRERKRRKDRKGSTRHVPLHPRLKVVMEAWFGKHPGGSFTVSPPKNMPRRKKALPSANHLTPSQADHHFETTLKGSKWSVVRGFHVFRHSFGSNLIRSGTVSSDVVAKWMGHSTMEMRELYQHVFPQDGVEQISLLS